MSEETLLNQMEEGEDDQELDEEDGVKRRINPFKVLPHILLAG